MNGEKNRSKSSTPSSWSRPDGDLFTRAPISTEGQQVVVSELFLVDPAVKQMAAEAKTDAALHGVLTVLYFVFDPKAPMYKGMSKGVRLDKVLRNHVDHRSQAKVRKLIETQAFEDLRKAYLEITTTRSERMLIVLKEQIDRFIDQTNELEISEEDTGNTLLKRLEKAQEMQERLESLEAFVNKEGQTKTRGNYRTALFERREAAATALA